MLGTISPVYLMESLLVLSRRQNLPVTMWLERSRVCSRSEFRVQIPWALDRRKPAGKPQMEPKLFVVLKHFLTFDLGTSRLTGSLME